MIGRPSAVTVATASRHIPWRRSLSCVAVSLRSGRTMLSRCGPARANDSSSSVCSAVRSSGVSCTEGGFSHRGRGRSAGVQSSTAMTGIDRGACEALDRDDPLRRVREEFDVDDDVIYLDGNSLGRPPRATAERVNQVMRTEWARGLIRGWADSGWMESPLRAGAAIAPLIGADPDEVVVGDSTSVCLFKVLATALQGRPD